MDMTNDSATVGYHISKGSLGSDDIFNDQLLCMYKLVHTTNFNAI